LLKQLIYDFGITQNVYTINKLQYDDSLQNIESVVNDVIFNVKDSYYYLITCIEKRRVMEDTVEQFEQTYAQAKAFYDVGVKPKIDVTIAETNLANARAELIKARNNVDIATATLNNSMGLPFIASYMVEEKLPFQELDTNMDELIETANNSRPALKSAIINVKMANQQLKLTNKVFFPSLEFQGNFTAGGRQSGDLVNWYDFGGYLPFPTINPFLIKNHINEMKFNLQKQREQAQTTVNDVYFEIQKTWAQLHDAQERVPVALLSMKQSLENYELAKGRYYVGESDAIELKDAQVQYQDSQLAYYTTLYEYNSAKAMLEKAVGQTLKNKENKPEEI
jgi:outer membrane protein TolC